MYVDKSQTKAVVFAFDVYPGYAEKQTPVRLQGLNANKMYRVSEICTMPGEKSSLKGNGMLYSGEYLMNTGLSIFTGGKLNSRIIELKVE